MTDPRASLGPEIPFGHAPVPVLDRVVGQPRARAVLESFVPAPVESYLFVGPAGSGKRDAAMAFAAALVCPDGGCGVCDACLAALVGTHPDVSVIERAGAAMSRGEADTVTALSQRTPTAAPRQVVVLVDFHLAERMAPALLKTIEESPPTTVFVVLAETVPPPLVTIASRCVDVVFNSLAPEVLAEVLAAEGVDADTARLAARGAGGRLDRARLLAGDPGFAEREARWRAVPERLDGTGATVALLAAELLAGGEELLVVLRERQGEEIAMLAAQAERNGERQIAGRQGIEDRHRREQRRVRTDELRAGLSILANAYRNRLLTTDVPGHRPAALMGACTAIEDAGKALVRNPNESLLVQSLLLELDRAR